MAEGRMNNKAMEKLARMTGILSGLLCLTLASTIQAAPPKVGCPHQPEALAHLLKPEEQARAAEIVDQYMKLDWVDSRGQLPYPGEYYEKLIVEKPFRRMSGSALIRSYKLLWACTYMPGIYDVKVALDLAAIRVRIKTADWIKNSTTPYDDAEGTENPSDVATLIAEYPALNDKLLRPRSRLNLLHFKVVKDKLVNDWRIYHGDQIREHVGLTEEIRITNKFLQVHLPSRMTSCQRYNECDSTQAQIQETKRYLKDLESLVNPPQGNGQP